MNIERRIVVTPKHCPAIEFKETVALVLAVKEIHAIVENADQFFDSAIVEALESGKVISESGTLGKLENVAVSWRKA